MASSNRKSLRILIQPKNTILEKDLAEILETPITDVIVDVDPENRRSWNLIFSYEDRIYFGQLNFPINYPWIPPDLLLCQRADAEEPKRSVYIPLIENWSPTNTARDVIVFAKNIIWRFCASSKLILFKSLQSIQADIFCDVMQFLNRQQIEKCQLVSKSWKKFMDIFNESLPLRLFKSLLICFETNGHFTSNKVKISKLSIIIRIDEEKSEYQEFFSKTVNREVIAEFDTGLVVDLEADDPGDVCSNIFSNNLDDLKTAKIKALKNVVFEEITFSSKRPTMYRSYVEHEHPLLLTNELRDCFQQIVEIMGQKFQGICFKDNLEEYGHFLSPNENFYSMLFHYVQVKCLTKILRRTGVKKLGYLTNVPTPPFTINIFFDIQSRNRWPVFYNLVGEYDQENEGVIMLAKFFDKFIVTANNEPRHQRYNLTAYGHSFDENAKNLCKKYLELFTSTDHIEKLPTEINFVFSQNSDANIMKFLENFYCQEEKMLTKFKIESDDGKLKGILWQRGKSWYCKIGVEFTTYGNIAVVKNLKMEIYPH